ncbi:copper homeostasis protein CutC [Erysipelotrichaceae bacterium 66-17]
MNEIITIEVCAGSLEDALAAHEGGAQRIELNSALSVGGLSPSLYALTETKKRTNLEVICMVRPRAAGFCYSEIEKNVMIEEAKCFLEHGADGIAFGFLNADRTIDTKWTKKMVELIHSYEKTAVFHRAVDVVSDYESAFETLVDLGVDRVLTSGTHAKAIDGADRIQAMQERFADRIEILPGSGVNARNARSLIERTGTDQLHSSCKGYRTDPTTSGSRVSYAYLSGGHENEYDIVEVSRVRALVEAVK